MRSNAAGEYGSGDQRYGNGRGRYEVQRLGSVDGSGRHRLDGLWHGVLGVSDGGRQQSGHLRVAVGVAFTRRERPRERLPRTRIDDPGHPRCKCVPLIVTNCTIWSRYERAVGLAGAGTVQLDNSVIGGAKYGLLNTAGTIAANHVTIVEMPNLAFHCEAAGTLRNSIVIGCAGAVLNRGSGDYIDVFNSGATPYSGTWNGGSGAGPNDISLDPEFMLGGFAQDDPNRFDPTWLRYPWSSPAAEAGEDGTYLGAFPPYGTKPAVGSVVAIR